MNKDWYTDQVYDFAVLAHNDRQFPYLPFKDKIVLLNGEPKATKFWSLADVRKFEIMLYGSEGLRVRS